MKVCNICQRKLAAKAFDANVNTVDKLQPTCKKCRHEEYVAWKHIGTQSRKKFYESLMGTPMSILYDTFAKTPLIQAITYYTTNKLKLLIRRSLKDFKTSAKSYATRLRSVALATVYSIALAEKNGIKHAINYYNSLPVDIRHEAVGNILHKKTTSHTPITITPTNRKDIPSSTKVKAAPKPTLQLRMPPITKTEAPSQPTKVKTSKQPTKAKAPQQPKTDNEIWVEGRTLLVKNGEGLKEIRIKKLSVNRKCFQDHVGFWHETHNFGYVDYI